MRILIDYRPALRERTGVGEYVHRLALALAATAGPADPPVTLFSSSWKDRLRADALDGRLALVDRRIPVAVLNRLWHRGEWPPVELLAGRDFDVVHSMHPLLTPSRRAAQVVTVHDLDFLDHPERTRAEVRRDYPVLATSHAARAHAVIVPSRHVARQVTNRLAADPAKVRVCPLGAPEWPARAKSPDRGHLLFIGTLEPRKNVGALLDAYERLLAADAGVPDLVLAGKATPEGRGWLDRLGRHPLAGRVRAPGYVQPAERRALFEQALMLVLPSLEEGFGLPALEAMTLGVPVVASNRGALPELLEDAGLLVDPADPEGLAAAMRRILADGPLRTGLTARGLVRARAFRWDATARAVRDAYRLAVERRRRVGT